MTMSDEDWGVDQWDVDSKADSLNKALFGKKQKSHSKLVKPDLENRDKNGTDFIQDSGDDDHDDDKISRKGKKKLKEKRRKENLKNKKKNLGGENATEAEMESEKSSDNKEEYKKTKLSKSQSNSNRLSDKKKGKSGNHYKMESKIKGAKVLNEKGKIPEKKKEDGGKKIKKKKDPPANDDDDEEGVSPAKRMKVAEGSETSESKEEDQRRKRNRRKKKKKPSSKKNKYKHLDLKQDKPVSQDSDSDNESKDIIKSKNDNLVAPVANNKGTQQQAKKRKRSLSPETLPEKKVKKASPLKKLEKQKKTFDMSQTNGAEEKMEVGDNTCKEKSKKLKKKNKDKSVNNETETNKKSVSKMDENKPEKSESKKMKKEKKEKESKNKEEEENSPQSTVSPFFSSQGMELQQKCMDKLISGRFRFINEQLYTIKGGDAFRMFQQDKTLMDVYHTGFQSQVKQWSVNPLDIIIKQISSKPKHLKVADFGCGEARLSASVPQTVHSLDLYALNEKVTVCNMAKTPLESESLDIAVFCLSLMGTNLNDYLLEANRVLKEGGLLKVAEVVSRFTDFKHFVSAVCSMGFQSVNSRELSKMFYLMDFKKVKNVKKTSKQIKALTLNPCVYKKR